MDIVPFRDHLRAYNDVEFAFIQGIQCAFEVFMATNRIPIEAGDARLGKNAVEQLFQLLRPGSKKIDVFAAAMDAGSRYRRDVAAVVADHLLLSLVVG